MRFIAELSENPNNAARDDPMSRMIAFRSSMRSSSGEAPGTRSESPCPTLVERDDAGEFGEAAQPVRVAGELVREFDMGDDARHDNRVNRPLTHGLIRDFTSPLWA